MMMDALVAIQEAKAKLFPPCRRVGGLLLLGHDAWMELSSHQVVVACANGKPVTPELLADVLGVDRVQIQEAG